VTAQASRLPGRRLVEERGRIVVDAGRLLIVVRAYRFMAYLTGTMLIILCFAGIPLQVFGHDPVIARYVGTAHGVLYLIYLVVAFAMTRLVRMRTASVGTVVVLAAGTVPIATFVVERWVTRRYVAPALAAAPAAAAPTAVSQ
jgi:integral membrane protein